MRVENKLTASWVDSITNTMQDGLKRKLLLSVSVDYTGLGHAPVCSAPQKFMACLWRLFLLIHAQSLSFNILLNKILLHLVLLFSFLYTLVHVPVGGRIRCL